MRIFKDAGHLFRLAGLFAAGTQLFLMTAVSSFRAASTSTGWVAVQAFFWLERADRNPPAFCGKFVKSRAPKPKGNYPRTVGIQYEGWLACSTVGHPLLSERTAVLFGGGTSACH